MKVKILVKTLLLAEFSFLQYSNAQSLTPVNFQTSAVFTTSVGAQPSDIVVSDFNRDGMADVAVTERGLNQVAVYVQGNNGFVTPAAATAPAGQSPSALAAVTLTPNGPVDDIVALSGPDGIMMRLLNSGPGQPLAFLPQATSSFRANFRGQNPRLIATYLSKSDAYIDFVIADDQSLRPGLLVGISTTGNINWRNPALSPGGVTPSASVAAIDMDGDAYMDLLSTDLDNDQVAIFYNSGCTDGCWNDSGRQLLLPSGGTTPIDAQATDLNQDSQPDVVAANGGTPSFSYSLSTSQRQFNPPVVITLPAVPRRLRLVELNGDRFPEVVVLCADNTVRVFRNTGLPGPARFVQDAVLPTGLNPTAMAIADIDGDNRQDIAVSCADDNTVHIYRNARPLSTRQTQLAGVEVYPNSATEILNVTLPTNLRSEATVNVLDATGRVILQESIKSGRNAINVSPLPGGVYVLRLTSSQGVFTQRIMLTH